MLYYNFKDYKDFNELFGITKHGNGVKSRKNAILLSFLKNPNLLKNNEYELLSTRSLVELKANLVKRIREELYEMDLPYHMILNGTDYRSPKYSTDNNNGLCEDGDYKSIRYFSHGKGQIFKKKAGKIYLEIIQECEFGRSLETNIRTWLVEELARDWQTYAYGLLPANTLHVDDNFNKIYSSGHLYGCDCGSCMVDRGRTDFYKYSVKAKAAYLTNSDDKIIARCIIFTDVYDENGKKWRLAERQYSHNCDLIAQQALIDGLIVNGFIDGYKKVGAGCGDSRLFLDINGNSLMDKKFHISCTLGMEDILSYQDSFKWYDYNNDVAYNYHHPDANYDLATTDLNLYGDDDCEDDAYDDFHEYSCSEVQECYYHGRVYFVDVNNMDNFHWVSSVGQYHHDDDIIWCNECNEYQLDDKSVYSDITGEDYCCEACRDAAEKRFKEQNWYYSDFDQDYYEFEDDIARFYTWDEEKQFYVAKTISTNSLEAKIEDGAFIEFDGDYYPTIETDNAGVPFYFRKEVLYAVA